MRLLDEFYTFFFFTIRFSKYKKSSKKHQNVPKSTKRHQKALKSNTKLRFIDLKGRF